MHLSSSLGQIQLIDEHGYQFGSNNHARHYPFAKDFDPEYASTSVHGVLLNGAPLAVFGDSGGASAVHEHSALLHNELLYLAIGRHVVCLRPSPFEFRWALQTDSATCFGIYFDSTHNAFVSHGELEIARFTEDANIVWTASGADIFTEGLSLCEKFIEVLDFDRKVYHFSYDTGNICA